MEVVSAPLVIIPCGGRKLTTRCSADLMYTGPYHRACKRFAMSVTGPENVLILSARYGLLRLTDEIDTYDLKMGQTGSVKPETVEAQAKVMGLLVHPNVIAIGGTRYTEVVSAVWPNAMTPLTGVGGLGMQIRWLAEHSKSHIREEVSDANSTTNSTK